MLGLTMSKKATREAFGEALLKAGANHKNVDVLDADLSKSTKSDAFAKAYPQRFFEMGIAEQNMVGVAAGIVAHATADGLGDFAQVGNQRMDVEGGEGGVVLQEIIGVGDVGLVVLAVMDFHRLGVDVGLKSVMGVWQIGQGHRHGDAPVFGWL